MVSAESMRRGAQEANEENDRLATARKLGDAIGTIAGVLMEVRRAHERIDALAAEVAELRGEPK